MGTITTPRYSTNMDGEKEELVTQWRKRVPSSGVGQRQILTTNQSQEFSLYYSQAQFQLASSAQFSWTEICLNPGYYTHHPPTPGESSSEALDYL